MAVPQYPRMIGSPPEISRVVRRDAIASHQAAVDGNPIGQQRFDIRPWGALCIKSMVVLVCVKFVHR